MCVIELDRGWAPTIISPPQHSKSSSRRSHPSWLPNKYSPFTQDWKLSATPTEMSATQPGVSLATQSISLSQNGISPPGVPTVPCLQTFLHIRNFSPSQQLFVQFSFNWFCNGGQVGERILRNFMMQRIHRNFLANYVGRQVPSDFWF